MRWAMILLLMALCTVGPTRARAQTDDLQAREALAERLIEATVTASIDKIVDDVIERMLAEQTDVTDEQAEWTRVNMPTIMDRHLQVMIDQIEAHYIERFTETELRALVDFYETPEGREIARKQNEVSALMGESMTTFMVAFVEDYVAKFCAAFDCPAGALDAISPAKN